MPPALSASTRFGLVWFGLRQYKSNNNKFPQIIFDIGDWLTNLIVVGLCSVLLSPHTVYLRLKDAQLLVFIKKCPLVQESGYCKLSVSLPVCEESGCLSVCLSVCEWS